MRPRFSFCRRTGEDVGLVVTFSTGSTMSLQKKVPRRSSFRSNAVTFTPVSAPVSRSAFKNGLFSVSTLARRKLRYNSFSVGARKARYIEAVTETLRFKERRTESRGLNARSLREGYKVLGEVHTPESGVQIELASKLFQLSTRPPRMMVQSFQRTRSSPKNPRMRWRPPAALLRVCAPAVKNCSSLAPITSIRSAPPINV